MGHRVLQLISSAGFFGAESVLVELSACLHSLGTSPIVGVLDHGNEVSMQIAEVARRRGLEVQAFDCRSALDWRTIGAIDRLARDRDVSVVHSHGYKSNTYALLSNLGRRRRLVSTCHNWINATAKMRLYAKLDRMVLRRFDAVVPVSMSVRAALVEAGFDARTLTVIENGIDTSRFRMDDHRADARAEFGFGPNDFAIGVVARLGEEKGHKVLFEALGRPELQTVPWRLLLIGDGPLRPTLETAAAQAGFADRVTFAGRRDDVPRLLPALDLAALPSLVEAQPMALLEAMASGIPVLASAVGDVPRILEDGRLGRIVPPGDAAALAGALASAFHDKAQALAVAATARVDVVERRSSQGMARRYVALYDRLCADEVAARS